MLAGPVRGTQQHQHIPARLYDCLEKAREKITLSLICASQRYSDPTLKRLSCAKAFLLFLRGMLLVLTWNPFSQFLDPHLNVTTSVSKKTHKHFFFLQQQLLYAGLELIPKTKTSTPTLFAISIFYRQTDRQMDR